MSWNLIKDSADTSCSPNSANALRVNPLWSTMIDAIGLWDEKSKAQSQLSGSFLCNKRMVDGGIRRHHLCETSLHWLCPHCLLGNTRGRHHPILIVTASRNEGIPCNRIFLSVLARKEAETLCCRTWIAQLEISHRKTAAATVALCGQQLCMKTPSEGTMPAIYFCQLGWEYFWCYWSIRVSEWVSKWPAWLLLENHCACVVSLKKLLEFVRESEQWWPGILVCPGRPGLCLA